MTTWFVNVRGKDAVINETQGWHQVLVRCHTTSQYYAQYYAISHNITILHNVTHHRNTTQCHKWQMARCHMQCHTASQWRTRCLQGRHWIVTTWRGNHTNHQHSSIITQATQHYRTKNLDTTLSFCLQIKIKSFVTYNTWHLVWCHGVSVKSVRSFVVTDLEGALSEFCHHDVTKMWFQMWSGLEIKVF